MLLDAVVTRVLDGVRLWVETGRLPDLPREAYLAGPAGMPPSAEGGGPDVPAQAKRAGNVGLSGNEARTVPAHLAGGRPLESAVRARMESAFGATFSGVRVHDDSAAASMNSRLSARAVTAGNDIAFGRGEYRPGSLAGDLLIAHELAHVVQQRGARSAAVREESPGGRMEEEADRAALAAVLAGKSAPLTSAPGLGLQRCSKSNGNDSQLQSQINNVPPISPNDIEFTQVMENPEGFPTYSTCLTVTVTVFECTNGICVPVSTYECEIEISFPGRTARGIRNYPGAVQGIVAEVLNSARQPLSGMTSCTRLVGSMTSALRSVSGARVHQGCTTMIGPNRPPVTPVPPLH
jgi:hypothetical protein